MKQHCWVQHVYALKLDRYFHVVHPWRKSPIDTHAPMPQTDRITNNEHAILNQGLNHIFVGLQHPSPEAYGHIVNLKYLSDLNKTPNQQHICIHLQLQRFHLSKQHINTTTHSNVSLC